MIWWYNYDILIWLDYTNLHILMTFICWLYHGSKWLWTKKTFFIPLFHFPLLHLYSPFTSSSLPFPFTLHLPLNTSSRFTFLLLNFYFLFLLLAFPFPIPSLFFYFFTLPFLFTSYLLLITSLPVNFTFLLLQVNFHISLMKAHTNPTHFLQLLMCTHVTWLILSIYTS